MSLGLKGLITKRNPCRVTADVRKEEVDAATVERKKEVEAVPQEVPSVAAPLPIPSVVISSDGTHNDHGVQSNDHGSDSGSVYEESVYSNGHEHSHEDLSCRGHARLHLRYHHLKNLLEVTVRSVGDLVSKHDSADQTNPFVRLYLLPDRSKRSRRTTRVIKGALSADFSQTFEYPIGLDQLRNRRLEVAVKSDSGFFVGRVRNRLLGTGTVDLAQYDLTDGCDVSCDLYKFRPSS